MRSRLQFSLLSIVLCSCTDADPVAESVSRSVTDRHIASEIRGDVQFTQLSDTVWMHTTVHETETWGPVPSNGIIVVGATHAVLVDTAWTNAQTQTILEWTADVLDTPVTAAVFTHAHQDKMGGVQALRDAGVATYAHPLSNEIAPTHGLVPAEFDLAISDDGSVITPEELALVDVFYPGAGHTRDNIVVNARGADILFGGCLVRSGGSTSLGNTDEASIPDWAQSADNVTRRFPDATVVVPSHGPPGGPDLLALTADLARKAQVD